MHTNSNGRQGIIEDWAPACRKRKIVEKPKTKKKGRDSLSTREDDGNIVGPRVGGRGKRGEKGTFLDRQEKPRH